MDRREFICKTSLGALSGSVAGEVLSASSGSAQPAGGDARPNILFCIADDMSWLHAGAMGDKVVKTPTFDRVAREGVLVNHAYCCAPSCSPSRSGILTGQAPWRLEEGGDLWGTLPSKFPVYPDILEAAGYHVGYMRKGWGPGQDAPGGRKRNAAGNRYQSFDEFFKNLPAGRPFCFWFGSFDPHRPYELDSGAKSGMKIEDVVVPPHLPDVPEVRGDILDYYFEVERYDRDIGNIIKVIEDAGQLDNTLIVITSDNGMPFPRSKANLYDYGVRMPLAVRWPARVKAGRRVDDFVSLTDIAPTFLEAAGLPVPPEMTGKSFLNVLTSDRQGLVDPTRDKVFTGRERHAWCRADGLGYPARAIRTHQFLYIRNFEPDRWPAGDPEAIGRWTEGFGDCDDGPTKTYMLQHRDDPKVKPLFDLAFGKRPSEELYDCEKDPDQLNNVADDPKYRDVRNRLSAELDQWMQEINDARALGKGEQWDKYPYYGADKGN